MSQLNPYFPPLGRIMIALIFLLSGFGKLTGIEGTQAYMESAGLPGILAYPAALFEVAAALAVIVGWRTRIAALLLAGFSLLTALIFHFDFGDQIQRVLFLKNIAMAGGFLFLVRFGAGEFSLDAKRERATASSPG